MAKIVLAEDDLGIAQPLIRALEREGYAVEHVTDGLAVDSAAADCDLLVLDLGLPNRDGLDVCRQLRARDAELPIIILSARADVLDLIIGLDAGADDYVTKPFRTSELQARIRAALRRRLKPTLQAVGQLLLDPASHEVTFADQPVPLTPKEFALLEVLMTRSPAVVSREELLREIWETDWLGGSKTIDMHVSSLRRKLTDAGARRDLITTVRGIGFRCTRP